MSNQPKVAIPRLQRPGQEQVGTKDRRRVSRACTTCRTHKVKCTGERPKCKHCAITNQQCVYILPRKDRLRIVTERCQQMATLLKGLRSQASEEDQARIMELLEAADDDLSEDRQAAVSSGPETDINELLGGAESGSADNYNEPDTESLDFLDEDLHTNDYPRAIGFIGKSSEIQWLRAVATAQAERLDEEVGGPFSRRGSQAMGGQQVSSFTYWSDHEGVDIDFYVDPYEMPQVQMAERLVEVFMAKVHPSFPILDRKTFDDQFRAYFRAVRSGSTPRPSPKWQVISNLVFALGAKYSHLVEAEWRGDKNDHVIYQARSRAFSLNQDVSTNHPDLPRIQGLGLLAFYWLAVGQVSRAWSIVGVALRFAYSLGLHIRNEDSSATPVKRETFVRTWWSLYTLERTLGVVTGRPSIIVDSCCSVPLPMSVPEDQNTTNNEAAYQSTLPLLDQSINVLSSTVESLQSSTGLQQEEPNSGSYFKAVVTLSIIVQDISSSLYSVATMIRPPEELQLQVVYLKQRLDQWAFSLPRKFNFQTQDMPPDARYIRERTILGFQFCSAKILLTRPYLSGRRQPHREHEEAGFAQRMGNICIEAAKTAVELLPDNPNPHIVYNRGPWWCIVHHMMQAVAVFLLGLSNPPFTSYDRTVLVHYTRKVIQNLQSMPDPIAFQACKIALETFDTVMRLRFEIPNWEGGVVLRDVKE